jgi:hypothetical protein
MKNVNHVPAFLLQNQEEIAKTLEQKLNDVEQKERMLDQQIADNRLVRIHLFAPTKLCCSP